MGLIDDLAMSFLYEYVRKEKMSALGEKVFNLLSTNGKVDLREVEKEFFDVAMMSVIKDGLKGADNESGLDYSVEYGDKPVKKGRAKKPAAAQAKVETEKPRRGRKPKTAVTTKKEERPKRKYTRKPKTTE
jgi:hypothetical protein